MRPERRFEGRNGRGGSQVGSRPKIKPRPVGSKAYRGPKLVLTKGATLYRRGAHTVYEIHVHLVWTTKYRKPVLVGEAATRVRDLIREICGIHDVKIMMGHVSKDHVHLLVSIPPQVTISRLLQWLKRVWLSFWTKT